MKKMLLFDFVVTGIVGTLLHFLYDWSGQNAAVGIIGAVNESIWEHLKLLFWPVAILSIAEFFIYFKRTENFLISRFIGLLCGMLAIVTLYYTVTGIVGKNIDVFNVVVFFIGDGVTFIVSRLFQKNNLFQKPIYNTVALIAFGALAAIFAYFTFNPLNIGIFKDNSK